MSDIQSVAVTVQDAPSSRLGVGLIVVSALATIVVPIVTDAVLLADAHMRNPALSPPTVGGLPILPERRSVGDPEPLMPVAG